MGVVNAHNYRVLFGAGSDVVRQCYAFGQLEIGQMQCIAQTQIREIDFDKFWQVLG